MACVVGGPPPARSEMVRSGALLHQDDPPPTLGPFAGRILRLLAWNTHVDGDELLRLARDASATPAVGPSDWSRSVLTDQTRHRCLTPRGWTAATRP